MLSNGSQLWKPVLDSAPSLREVAFYERVAQLRASQDPEHAWCSFLPPCVATAVVIRGC